MSSMLTNLIGKLVQNNLGDLAQTVVDKGLDAVQDKLGVKLNENLSEEDIKVLESKLEKHKDFIVGSRNVIPPYKETEDSFSKRFLHYYAYGLTTVCCIYLACITFIPIPEANTRFADTIVGFVLAGIVGVFVNYFFGSSHKQKSEDRG